ncbi:hypothetical protein Tco_1495544, partial [Tanacetum coccineum]
NEGVRGIQDLYDLATRKVAPKPKYVWRSTREKTKHAPKASSGKRLKATAKVTKSGKKKQPAKGLETLSEIALTEAAQMKIVTKRSKTQFHSSHASGLGTDEGIGVSLGVPDIPTYESEDEQISWKSSEENDDEEVSINLRVQTPSHYESTDDEESGEETQGANVEGEELDEEETNEEDEGNELYRDVNVNMEGRDTKMTDVPRTIVQTTQVIEDTHVIITLVNPEGQQHSFFVSSGFVSNLLNPSPDTGIDSIFNVNTESTSLVDVPVTTIAEMPLSLKTLENDFSEFKQTNQFAAAVSSIPDIVDTYLANKMNEAVKIAVQLQSDRLKDKAQAENEDFINTLNDNIKKIIKEQVKEQVKAQVFKILPKIEKIVNEQLLTCSSNKSKTSHAVSANLSDLELKKILIYKMERNKSIHSSDEQENLYKALVDAYESDKLILDTYGDTVSFKRRPDDEDKDEEPSAGSNQGSKRRRARKEPESTSAPKEKTSKTIGKSTEGSKSHHESTDKSAQEEEPMH